MKSKYCVIRKVPYRVTGTDRMVWANVVSERNGLALLLVAKSFTDGDHSILFAEENPIDRIFQSVGSPTFEIGSMGVKTIGDTLQILGMNFLSEEFRRTLEEELGDL